MVDIVIFGRCETGTLLLFFSYFEGAGEEEVDFTGKHQTFTLWVNFN